MNKVVFFFIFYFLYRNGLKHASDQIRKGIYQEKVLQKNGRDNFMTLEDGVKKIREVYLFLLKQ